MLQPRNFWPTWVMVKSLPFTETMGTGKTTFIKAIWPRVGSTMHVITSPTFAIVNEYTAGNGDPIYHFDSLYRIKKIDEVYDMGYEDYFYGGNLCLLELARTHRTPSTHEDVTRVQYSHRRRRMKQNR